MENKSIKNSLHIDLGFNFLFYDCLTRSITMNTLKQGYCLFTFVFFPFYYNYKKGNNLFTKLMNKFVFMIAISIRCLYKKASF